MLQVAWVTAALVCFLRAVEEEEKRQGDKETRRQGGRETISSPCLLVRLWWLAALLCVAGGVLTKWTAPAFFYLTVIALLWCRGQLRLLWCRNHLVSAAVGAGLCLAWAGPAVALQRLEVFVPRVSRQALMHLSPGHHHRPYPWLETLVHPFRIWGASLPVSAFALPTLWPGFSRLWDERGRRLLQVLHCWTWPNLVFWSFVPAHGTRHSFPLFPGLAGLAAMVWVAWLTGQLPWRWPRFSPGKALVSLVALWLVVKLAFVHGVIPERNKNREPREKGHKMAALVPAGETLYVFHLKDEGIMFYYGRPVRRLPNMDNLPSSGEP